ncbi:hypothetical protein PVK06_019552 [Gossypium arboreum]|uniref:Uncharacterized protein n=1 Tax=Gossypium arboreum TaxID=29729 RepID=A0ABR0PK05_GOSAR|nr:hypothetical protein PVK06_019552 [Gossypium arboreum]
MSANEARKVLSIPLSRHRQEDKQAWRAQVFGEYSVRSGYKLLLKESAEVEPNLQRSTSRQEKRLHASKEFRWAWILGSRG